jgi:hypothetical protein
MEPNTEINVRSEVTRERLLQIKFLWDVNALSTGKQWLTFQSIDPEHEGITIFRNIGKYLAAETAWHPRRLDSSAKELCYLWFIFRHFWWFGLQAVAMLISGGLQGVWQEAVMAWRVWGTRKWTSLRIGVSEPIFETGTLGTGKRIVTQSKAKAFSQARSFLRLFVLTPPANLHHFLIYDLSILV